MLLEKKMYVFVMLLSFDELTNIALEKKKSCYITVT